MKKNDMTSWIKDNWYEFVKILGTIYLSSMSIFSSDNIHWFNKALAGVIGLFIIIATIVIDVKYFAMEMGIPWLRP